MNEIFNHPNLEEKCVRICILNEGGSKVTNRPNDKGGITKYGISDMSDGIRDGKVLLADGKTWKLVKDLTEADAIGIYSARYYRPLNAQYLKSDELILNLFDFGVTSGPETSIKLLQRVLGLDRDGSIGSKTATAANNYPGNLVEAFKGARCNSYNKIADIDVAKYKETHPKAAYPELLKFTDEGNREGWISRVNNLKLA